jgi:tRNA A-37 threonylcarbamoyl transferase component Bud32
MDDQTQAFPKPAFDDDEELLLSPSMPAEAAGAAARGGDRSLHMELVAGPSVSIGTELQGILRSRLRSAALALLVVYLTLLAWGLAYGDRGASIVHNTMILRAILAGAVFAALSSSRVLLSLSALRGIELLLFGGITAMLVLAQYIADAEFIRERDAVFLVAYEKNGALQMIFLMMLYGVLIPNRPERTAKVVLTLLMAPLITLVLALVGQATPDLHERASTHTLAINNALYLCLGAALAIYAAFVLNRMGVELREARRLGQYRLGERLGSGGMGDVFLAEHQLLKRPCALKTIHASMQANPLAQSRFEREVQSAARLSHPNTIAIYDYGHTDNGTFYYVMEYLPGLSLDDLVKQFGPLPPGRAVYLLRQVCGGLTEAHLTGLIHRDLKPANVFVAILGGQCDVAKILDFGLVKQTNDDENGQLTVDQMVSGTPQYMAPEQARGVRELDARADQYAIGGVLYFTLTGRPPFEGGSAMDLMIKHARDPVTPPSKLNPIIPQDLEAVVMRALQKDPNARFADVRELSRALGACACAADWDADHAEVWWREQAAAQAVAQVQTQQEGAPPPLVYPSGDGTRKPS